MIDRQQLLSDLQRLLQRLESDLLERSESAEVPDVPRTLRSEFERAQKAQRTAQNYEDWRTDAITQAAAAWVLSCVFGRFLEDNRLIDPPKIAGPTQVLPLLGGGEGRGEGANRLQQARDEHELYFRSHPTETDREYLLALFDELAGLPGTKDVFGEHNPIRELPNWLSGDAAGELLRFFQKIDASTGALVHDFTDSNWDTRFLGDLYQDLSEAARKKYALLQTPEFVEEFILDRTLDPALDEFGLEPPPAPGEEDVSYDSPSRHSKLITRRFRMIDPACGSGHFLLGSFPRILDRWMKKEPGTNVRELVQRTLDSIHGVDVNPFAVAIARFRLLLAAMRACGIERLADAPAFRMNLVCGDSLLHAPLSGGQKVLDFELSEESDECDHAYRSENLPELKRLLRGGQYHAVVANPPYIVPRDKQLNDRYRKRFASCHRQYSLAVPFLERIFQLAVLGGYTGQITANSFMKREFGKKLIESFFQTVDLTHVIDTSGAYIPGHGTPTVILFGRHRPPVASTLRTVMGIRGEPATPDDPARGLVWSAIMELINRPESLTQRREGGKEDRDNSALCASAPLRESSSHEQFVSVADSSRELFHKHPWSIGGGGASELKEQLDEVAASPLKAIATEIGFVCITKADELFAQPHPAFRRHRIETNHVRPFGIGEDVRDWGFATDLSVIFPYDATINTVALADVPSIARFMWPVRTELGNRIVFGGKTYFEAGKPWHEYGQIPVERAKIPLSIVFGEVATHNHFVLDRGGKVFKQTAPVIKLPREATEDDHLALLGLLNSSTACFWMRQCCHNKGGGASASKLAPEAWENFFGFNGTMIQLLPLPDGRGSRNTCASNVNETDPRPLASGVLRLARQIDELAQQRQRSSPTSALRASVPSRESLSAARAASDETLRQMIAAQEELDWECYRLYGLTAESLVIDHSSLANDQGPRTNDQGPMTISLGQRAFEIVLARKLAAGQTQTTWFERHGSTPITELPAEWPDDYRQLVQRRIDLIESDPNIRLIEQPEYKRRWNTESWDSQLERALREWLLNRLEGYFDFDGRMKESVQCSVDSVQEESQSDSAENRKRKTETPPPLAEIQLVSVARLASVAGQDADFLQVGELYRDDAAFDVQALVTELVAPECVPVLPVLRYKPAGLIKRTTWERTWDLQRQEDEYSRQLAVVSGQLENTKDPAETTRLKAELERLTAESKKFSASIAVPTKYDSRDFLTSDFWRLRGKLDVPKERWISFPHCDGPDGTMMLCWAGYDHLQQARAISAYFVDIQERLGGRDDPRLIPLLACIIELLPWLKQWHHDIDPEFNQRMDEVYEGFVTEEAKNLGMTVEEIKAWQPPQRASRQRRTRRAT